MIFPCIVPLVHISPDTPIPPLTTKDPVEIEVAAVVSVICTARVGSHADAWSVLSGKVIVPAESNVQVGSVVMGNGASAELVAVLTLVTA